MTPTQAFVAAIHAQLTSVLPALVAAQSLPAITEFLIYAPALPQPAKAPQVWIDVAALSKSSDEKRGSTLQKFVEERDLLIGVVTAGQDQSQSTDRLRGYADLIRKCVEANRNASGNALWVKWTRTDFSPTFGQGSALYREAVLSFDAPHQVLYGID